MNVVTDAQVFDVLHELFGAGTYDESTPWFRWRAIEISKIRATRKKRRVEPSELVITARWCRAHQVWVKEHWELYEHLTDALAADRAQQANDQSSDLESAIADAIAIEAALPDSPWLDRLIRAAGPSRAEVYREWKRWSSSSLSHGGGPAPDAPISTATGAPSGVR